jgi:dienelactone hydrolase
MVHDERIHYEVLGVAMIGYLATDERADAGARPAVLLMHEGGGQDDNVRARADRLAALGYVAFALDYLGGGTQHPLAAAQARLGELWSDPGAIRELALAGYRILTAQPGVDRERVAAVGFCFGGAMALELARAGVGLRAAIGFHPGFTDPRPADSAGITASVLMICGADDPVVSAADRHRFEDEMREANVAAWPERASGRSAAVDLDRDPAARVQRAEAFDRRRVGEALLESFAGSDREGPHSVRRRVLVHHHEPIAQAEAEVVGDQGHVLAGGEALSGSGRDDDDALGWFRAPDDVTEGDAPENHEGADHCKEADGPARRPDSRHVADSNPTLFFRRR